jgi:hypothetical protein
VKYFQFLFVIFLLANLTQARAGNGIDANTIRYKSWPAPGPSAVSVISGQVVRNLRLFGKVLPNGVSWEDSEYHPLENMQRQICDLVGEPCAPFKSRGVRVHEIYLGDRDSFSPPMLGGPSLIGLDSLENIGFGAKRVLVLQVEDMGQLMQTATVVFDAQISDDDLRQIALEDAVYRVLRYRED